MCVSTCVVERDPYERNLPTATTGWASNVWSKLLALTFFAYVAVGGVALVPSGGAFDTLRLVLLGIFTAFWVPFPVWLYMDRKRVLAETDYSPSKLYYLGWLPSYLGAPFVILYLAQRGAAYRALDGTAHAAETGGEDTSTGGSDAENATPTTDDATDSEYQF